jgi:aspartate oxidase
LKISTTIAVVVAAKSVILATGGIGRLHIQGFPTSNHCGATGDGLCLAYRLGAKLMHIDTFQYHPPVRSIPSSSWGVGDRGHSIRWRTLGQREG